MGVVGTLLIAGTKHLTSTFKGGEICLAHSFRGLSSRSLAPKQKWQKGKVEENCSTHGSQESEAVGTAPERQGPELDIVL